MADLIAKDKFAKVGETVIYTGDTKYAFDKSTLELMNKYLGPGNRYMVREIGLYGLSRKMYYKFEDSRWYYPCESFTKNFRETIKSIYNLK